LNSELWHVAVSQIDGIAVVQVIICLINYKNIWYIH